MITAPFFDARWLWINHPINDERDRRMRFRKTFDLPAVPEKFEALISADSRYNLYVNGQFVHHGPGRNTPPVCGFDRIDLASYLHAGKNLIAIQAYQFGDSNYSYAYFRAAGVIFYAPGVKSDESWKISEDPGYIRAVAKGSRQYAFQEFYDCRLSDRSWLEADFDDSAWESTPGRAAGAMPWHTFEERDIPLLTSGMIYPEKIVAVSGHEPDKDWRNIESVILPYHRETPDYQLPGAVDEPTCFVYDFGREVVGMLHFIFEAEDAMDFLVCEMLDGLTPRITEPGELHTAYGGRLYPAKDRVNEHELTLPWGMRYLVLFNRGKGKFKCEVSLRECRYPLDVAAEFHSSDPLLQKIWDMCLSTQKSCMADTYIDCPTREYAQWWGDALVQSQNTFALADDPRLLRRGLRVMARQTTPEGLTYGVSPGCGHVCILPDYSAMYLVTLLADYEQTRSLEMWRELRETASGIISYFEKYIDENGKVPFDERYWLFVDWCNSLDKVKPYNFIILWGIRAAAELAELSAMPEDKTLLERCRKLEKKLLKGLDFENIAPHTAALAILLDVAPERHRQLLDELLLPMIRGNHDHPVQPDAYFMYYVFEAVGKYGYAGEIIDCIRRWWKEFADAGLDTVPEHFFGKTKQYTSMCHAWSAHPLKFFSSILLGVRRLSPGWDEVAFAPVVPVGVDVSGVVPTPHGNIAVSVTWNGDKMEKSISLPPGIKCR